MQENSAPPGPAFDSPLSHPMACVAAGLVPPRDCHSGSDPSRRQWGPPVGVTELASLGNATQTAWTLPSGARGCPLGFALGRLRENAARG